MATERENVSPPFTIVMGLIFGLPLLIVLALALAISYWRLTLGPTVLVLLIVVMAVSNGGTR